MAKQRGNNVAAMLFGVLALGALYWFPMRRWFVRWGATASDLTRVMPGDPAAVDPSYSVTMAITLPPRDSGRAWDSSSRPNAFTIPSEPVSRPSAGSSASAVSGSGV